MLGVDRGIASPTSHSERNVPLSWHSAPGCARFNLLLLRRITTSISASTHAFFFSLMPYAALMVNWSFDVLHSPFAEAIICSTFGSLYAHWLLHPILADGFVHIRDTYRSTFTAAPRQHIPGITLVIGFLGHPFPI